MTRGQINPSISRTLFKHFIVRKPAPRKGSKSMLEQGLCNRFLFVILNHAFSAYFLSVSVFSISSVYLRFWCWKLEHRPWQVTCSSQRPGDSIQSNIQFNIQFNSTSNSIQHSIKFNIKFNIQFNIQFNTAFNSMFNSIQRFIPQYSINSQFLD